jgi:hypothetical protein
MDKETRPYGFSSRTRLCRNDKQNISCCGAFVISLSRTCTQVYPIGIRLISL